MTTGNATYRWILVLLATALLTRCASFYAQETDLEPRIVRWQEQHRYDKALNVIKRLPPEHPQYEVLNQRAERLNSERAEFIQQALNRAEDAASHQDWVFAIDILTHALKKTPHEDALLEQRAVYVEQQNVRRQRDRNAILLAKANYLIQARPFYESLLYHSQPDISANRAYEQYLLESQNASTALHQLAVDYWEQNLITQAKSALLLATRTAPNPESEALLTTVLSYEREQRRIARGQRTQVASEQWPELIDHFKRLVSNNDLMAAEWVLKELRELEAPNLDRLAQSLQTSKLEQSETLIKHGNTLYNAGLIEEALAHWQKALLLTPDNRQLEQNIRRAQSFLTNIERWSEDLPNHSN